ncbi:flagellar hook-associated protein FlgL [Pectinatus haikarae]|uniref:Flagellar hook-associated protein 3 FlgL n=1 Tax=Pectinatus haikarae TaxID=349096 RepID=A0ABT9Y4T1_9FIRM|nr:flagellar hook-associated protein FlgL [Pectinatus haikarae]MDQ0202832.1 flagellar hook-associated protein 3 FlgL [Pectinatus haikarae]
MRVSSTMMINNYMNALSNNYATQAKYVEQNATQQKLNRPSDDAVGYSKYLGYTNDNVENTQYTSNAQTAVSWMTASDTALSSIGSQFTTFVEQTNQAANGTNSTTDGESTAEEMLALLQETVSQGNTQLGGRYLFSGQSDKTQPFTMSTDKVERGLTKTLDDTQSEFFGKTVTIDGVSTKVDGGTQVNGLNQMISLKGSDGSDYYLDLSTGYVFSKDFVQSGYKNKMSAGQTSVTADDAVGRITLTSNLADLPANASDLSAGTLNATSYTSKTDYDSLTTNAQKDFLSQYFDSSNSGAITDTGKTASLSADGTDITFSFNTINQYVVSYAGDDNKISMVKLSGGTDTTRDSVNLTGSDVFGSSDIFGSSHGTATLNDLLTVVAEMDSGDQDWLSSDGITLANNAEDKLTTSQTSLASRNSAYSNAISTLNDQNTVIQDNINNVNGVDVAEVTTKLLTAQTIYNIALAISKDVLPDTIADYLS